MLLHPSPPGLTTHSHCLSEYIFGLCVVAYQMWRWWWWGLLTCFCPKKYTWYVSVFPGKHSSAAFSRYIQQTARTYSACNFIYGVVYVNILVWLYFSHFPMWSEWIRYLGFFYIFCVFPPLKIVPNSIIALILICELHDLFKFNWSFL